MIRRVEMSMPSLGLRGQSNRQSIAQSHSIESGTIDFHISATAKSTMTKYGARILMLLCVAVSPAYAKSDWTTINQSQNAQYERQFNTELFSKCNVCHKPFESTVIGSRTIPSYKAMSGMGQDAIKNGIEHGGHLSSADKSRIYAVLHPAAEPMQDLKKAKKKARKTKKHGKPKQRK